MSGLPRAGVERRLLILAPVGKDSALMQSMLRHESIASDACADVAHLAHELEAGAAAILVAEEALLAGDEPLARFVARQPPWSDIPVLLLTRRGADSHAVTLALERLGNVTLLERPLIIAALASAARTALRARERQYQTRAYLAERDEADQRKDEFLATLAHELRNPLAPIRNSVNILRLCRGSEPPPELCEMMARQVDVMVRLVDDLLEVSRITRGKIELRKERVELGTVIAAAIETSRPLIESARHELSLSLPGEPLRLDADAVRLAQVFANLLNNAVKYTDEGGRIAIEARREGAHALVVVSDTGVGITAQALPHVFDMFMQIDRQGGRAQSGLGIGLTLARSLVEMHGGSIAAQSDGAGCGSRFTVRLPLASSAQADRTRCSPVTAALPSSLPRILIVDDNRDAADSLAVLLRLLGAEASVAHDGREALERAKATLPGLVFLDLGMPEMDGFEVARRMREQPELRGTMIVALTGWGQEKDRRLTGSAGFDHHLVKPVDFNAMRAVLETACAR